MSLKDLMKKNARLRKAAEVAKKTPPTGGGLNLYNGPAGDVICKFAGMRQIEKDGNVYVTLDFTVDGMEPGQEKHGGQRIGLMRGLQDSNNTTAEEELNRLFGDIQRLGLETADMALEQIDDAVAGLAGGRYTIAAVTRKNDKTRLNFYLNGPATAGSSDPDYSSSETDEGVEAEPEPEPVKPTRGKKAKAKAAPEPEPAAEDDWSDELDDAAADDEDAGSVSCSDWIGQTVQYKPKGAPKLLDFVIVAADDEEGSVIIERAGKKLKVMFDALTLPE
jgi:hypothetical protein